MHRLIWKSIFIMMLLGWAVPQAQAVPVDFVDELVLNGTAPTDFTWTPDGRMLITSKMGTIYIYQNGSLVPGDALDIRNKICSDFERGLLGITTHPDFATNNYIYVYYTYDLFQEGDGNCNQKQGSTAVNTPVNRVSRFTLGANNQINPASEVVIVDNIHSPGGNHNGGDVLFGKDGYLYISVGDGGNDYETGSEYSGGAGGNDAARDKHVLLGKILRVTDTGGIPADNPFIGANTGICAVTGSTTPGNFCQETWVWGLRNPFRIALDSNAANTRIFINDVGQGSREEIDAGQAGADYGWNCLEGTRVNSQTGKCNPAPANMVPPIHEYNHNTGCRSITGGAFVPNGIWPSEYNGTYMYGDYVCGDMYVLSHNGTSWGSTLFDGDVGGVVTMEFGPYGQTQALYYANINNGQIRRIRYTGGNGAPTASFTATPDNGPAPLTVTFDGTASSDPEGGALTYIWNFGDGTPTLVTSSAVVTHTYNTSNSFTASLSVRDIVDQDSGLVEHTITVTGNDAPNITITSPSPGLLFAVGDQILFSASANDTEDGVIPAANMTMQVVLHHDTHTHPFLTVNNTNTITFTAPPPEDFLAASNSYLELVASATDSVGATSTVTQDLQPNKVELTFVTNPSELNIIVEGQILNGSTTVTSWENLDIDLSSYSQVANGNWWWLDTWSTDETTAAIVITTPAVSTTYTATYSIIPEQVFFPRVQR